MLSFDAVSHITGPTFTVSIRATGQEFLPPGHRKPASNTRLNNAGCFSYNNFSIAAAMVDGLVVGS
jgi:hypothetical protein